MTSDDINRLLELFGNIDIFDYEKVSSQKINELSLSDILTFLIEMNNYISELKKISIYFDEEILNNFLKENINYSDYLDDLDLLKNSLNGLLKIETSLESFIEFTRLKNNISNLGFKNGIDQLLEISKKSNKRN